MIALVRVDNRLIHGQVVEAWIPELRVSRILVADDEAAANALARAAMGLAVPAPVKVDVSGMSAADFAAAVSSPERTLVLVREVSSAVRAREHGLAFASLNLGNVHFASGRVQVSPSVFLSESEIESLRTLSAAGVSIDVRAVPKDRPLALSDIEGRVSAEGAPTPRPLPPQAGKG